MSSQHTDLEVGDRLEHSLVALSRFSYLGTGNSHSCRVLVGNCINLLIIYLECCTVVRIQQE